uniref:Calcium-dependent protein kinase n=2 Tax=Dunaliella tertiolecta TaxID=3047 RepID=A0A7S3R7M0_DUNTE|mmetsp:Transcript_14955/g.40351  ORF Transcript_14955/g.40351 Transcript_14955/m.40351 type:complete len:570 (+) Transcript_14955:98-1807(+)
MGNICTSSGHASAPDPKGKDAVLSNGAPPSSKPAAQAQSTQKQEHVPIHLSGPSMAPHDKAHVKVKVLDGVGADVREHYNFGPDRQGKIIGKGQFGTVRQATSIKTGEQVAVKSIAKRKLLTDEEVEDVRREVAILHHLVGHPALAQIHGVYEDKHYVHIVMQLAQGGELFDRIVERMRYSEKDAAAAFRAMVDVILHCHLMGVMHRDLKPENFLLADKSPNAQVICADFGLSTFFKEGEVLDDLVGSAYYVAPEVIQRRYSKEADMWSLGVILFILLSGSPPFFGKDEEAIFREIQHKQLDLDNAGVWPSISDPAKALVSRLLVRDPKKRMTAQEVLSDSWVQPGGSATDMPIQYEVVKRLDAFAKQNKLKKEAYRIIGTMLPDIEVVGLRELFKSIDADKSGHITFGELQDALKAKGFVLPSQELANLMSGSDLNQDRAIDYEEFIAATSHVSKITREDKMFQAFQILDTDNSGFIDPHELMAVITKHGGTNAILDLEEILEQVDKNSDGKIDYEEFAQMMYASIVDTSEEENMGAATVLNAVKSHGKSKGRRTAGACRTVASSGGL